MSQPSDDQIARAKIFHQKMAVRILSTAEVVGGLGGAAVGVAIAVRFSFPVGAVFITHGGDHFFTGLEGIWTGEEQTTLTTKVFGPEVDSALSIAEGVSAPFILPKAMGGFGNPFRMGRGAAKTPLDLPIVTTNRHGQLTNGKYTLDLAGMAPHTTGSLKAGKSQFLYAVNEKKLVLDASAIADQEGLWVGNKAKIVFDKPIGIQGSSGELTKTLNIYRTNTGFVHGAPGSP